MRIANSSFPQTVSLCVLCEILEWYLNPLTQWGWLIHICLCKAAHNCNKSLSEPMLTYWGVNVQPGEYRHVDTRIKTGTLLYFIYFIANWTLISGLHFSEILREIATFPSKKMHLEMLSAKCRPFCLSLDVLNTSTLHTIQLNVVINVHGPSRDCHETDLYNFMNTRYINFEDMKDCYVLKISCLVECIYILKNMNW